MILRPYKALRESAARIAKLESENRDYTATVTNALIQAAANSVQEGYSSGIEIAAGHISRAFASATISPRGSPFTPKIMGQIGRNLVEEGEAVYFREGLRLVRSDNYGIQPNGLYQVSAGGVERLINANRVFHVRWNEDANSGRGIGPLARASVLKDLASKVEGALESESNASVGYLLPLPAKGDSAQVDKLRDQLAALDGKVAIVESTSDGWGDGPQAAPRREYQIERMGPQYPESSIALYSLVRDTVIGACGVPVQLIQDSDGTAQREAWRRFLHGTIGPLGMLVEEAAQMMGLAISVNFENLFASDLMGRARAFQSLVGGGMDIERAAALSGLLIEGETNET